jgi:hypothetical protein
LRGPTRIKLIQDARGPLEIHVFQRKTRGPPSAELKMGYILSEGENMKFDWQQLSRGEREVLLRHFLLKRQDSPATAQKVCAVMQKTHYMSCHTGPDGKAVVQFFTTSAPERTGQPVRAGASLSEDLAEGIFKAALRAKGVQVEDGMSAAFAMTTSNSARAGR